MDFEVNKNGSMDLPQMTGYPIALLPGEVLAIELRSSEDAEATGPSLQIGLTPQRARELAAGLCEAVQAMGGHSRAAETELMRKQIPASVPRNEFYAPHI